MALTVPELGPEARLPTGPCPSMPSVWWLLGVGPQLNGLSHGYTCPCGALSSPGLAGTSSLGTDLMGSKFYLDFSPLQCQDLLSQTSSPLSQNDSCTGRSADLLLPPGDTGRRRHDSLHDPAAPSRAERFRVQVGQEGGCEQGSPDPSTTHVPQQQ